MKFLLFILLLTQVFVVRASESFSYSGRLVNANGSPVTGPVNLTFELAYSNQPGVIICSEDLNGVSLVNGVFHVKLEFASCNLTNVLANTPTSHTVSIRVIDRSASPQKVYSFQAVHSVPYSFISQLSKELVQMGATNGQVLTWNGTQWSPADPVGTVGGVVTIVGSEGVSAVRVDETVTVGIVDGGVTAAKLNSMGASSGQVLKWNGSVWAPAPDSDTGVASEADPHVRAFARNDVTGITPEICNPNQVLHYVSVDNSLRCFDLVDDAIVDGETNKAPSQNAVFDALALKQNTVDTNSELLMKSVRVTNDGTTWMGLKAPNAAGNIYFTLPAGAGVDGQVLKTDGAGNLAWVTPSSNSASIVDGSIVDADIAAGANIAQSKIAGLNTSLTDLDNRITNLTTSDIAEGTNQYFTEPRVLGADLAGLNTTNGTITAADTVLSSIGKLIGNLAVVSTAQSNYVLKSGDTMSGHLQMGGFNVTGLAAPTSDSDAATKKYVDDLAAAGSSKWTKTGNDISYSLGNVGIGTAAPSGVLEVRGGTAPSNTNGTNIVLNAQNAGAGDQDGGSISLLSGTSSGTGKKGHVSLGSTLNNSLYIYDGEINHYSGNVIIGARRMVDYSTSTPGNVILSPNNGSVGVGITSPETKLHVQGSAGATPNDILKVSGSGNPGIDRGTGIAIEVPGGAGIGVPGARIVSAIQSGGGSYLTFSTTTDLLNFTERMRIDKAGLVGIGTTTPVDKLDVDGNVGLSGKLRLKSDTVNYVELLAPTGLGATQTYVFPATSGASGQALTTNGSGALSWSDVATTSTSVGGDITGTIANAQIASGAVGSAEIADLSISNSDIANNTINYAKLYLVDGDIPQAKVNGLVTDLAGKEPVITNPNDPLKYWRGDKTWAILNTAVVPESTNLYFTQQRVLDSLLSGYAGTSASAIPIGDGESVLTSLKKLQLQITANDTAFDSTGQWSRNDPNIYFNTGNVGVGTNNPTVKFETFGGPILLGANAVNNDSILRLNSDGTATYNFIQFQNNGTTWGTLQGSKGGAMYYGFDNHIFRNGAGATEYMRINSTGNVGIGTTSPSSKLTAEATANILMVRNPDTNDAFSGGTMLEIANTGVATTNKYISFVADKDNDETGTVNFGSISLGGNNSLTISNPSNAAVAIQPSGGKVGIGTTDPLDPLHIRKDLGLTVGEKWLFRADHPAGGGVVIGYEGDGTNLKSSKIRSSSNTPLVIGTTNNTNALTINDNKTANYLGRPITSYNPNMSFQLGDHDWTDMIELQSGTFAYSSADKGIKTTGSTWFIIKTRMPIDPKGVYRATVRMKKLDGTGTFYVGASSLDANYNDLKTDLANSYNYFAASNYNVAPGVTYTGSGTISGHNLASESSRNKFDPGAKFFDLVIITNYTGSGSSVIESVEVYKEPTPEPWITPVFENGWVDYAAGYSPVAYYKDTNGIVHFRGLVKNGTVGPGYCIFTLPEGYRPPYRKLLMAQTNPNAMSRLDVRDNGCVEPTTGSSGWISLDGLSFRAAP